MRIKKPYGNALFFSRLLIKKAGGVPEATTAATATATAAATTPL